MGVVLFDDFSYYKFLRIHQHFPDNFPIHHTRAMPECTPEIKNKTFFIMAIFKLERNLEKRQILPYYLDIGTLAVVGNSVLHRVHRNTVKYKLKN